MWGQRSAFEPSERPVMFCFHQRITERVRCVKRDRISFFLSCFLNNAGMEIAMETQREVRLILWYAVPVTNDTPRALFPNIATAGNNIAHFSHVKLHCWGRILRFHAVHSSKCTKKTIQLTCVLLSPTLFF